jgi:hypothetical protein
VHPFRTRSYCRTRSYQLTTITIGFALIVSLLAPTAGAQLKGTAGDASAADAKAILAQVCTGGVSGSSCRTCPSYTAGDFQSGPEIGPMRLGSFTAPKAQEALVTIVGCEPHVNSWLGTVLLRKIKGRWKRVRYDAAVDVGNCLKFPYQSGVTLLVCESGWTGQGVTLQSINAIYVGASKTNSKILQLVTNNAGACLPTRDEVSIINWKQSDANDDGRADLMLTVSESHVSQQDGCQDASNPTSGKTVLTTLNYLFDGVRFTVAPGSKKAAACFGDEAASAGTYCSK